MIEAKNDSQSHVVLGQKYAYATMSLILAIACFVNLAGMEKAILAVIFARLALNSSPPPVLTERRLWAKAGLSIGVVVLIVIPAIIIFNFDRLRLLVEALKRMSDGK